MNKNMLKMLVLALVASVAVASQAEAASVKNHRVQQVVVRADSHRNHRHADCHRVMHRHDRCHARHHDVCHCRACEDRRRHFAHLRCHR